VFIGDAFVPGLHRFLESPAVADEERRVRQDEPGLTPGEGNLKRHAHLFRLDRIGGGEAGVCPQPYLLRVHPERDRAHGVTDAHPLARPAAGSRRGDVVLERPVDLYRGERSPVAQVVWSQSVSLRLSGFPRGACMPGGGLSHR